MNAAKAASISGCVPVLVTPFNEDRTIDFKGLGRLVNYYIDEGVEALWVLGTGGEDMAIAFDKRLSIVEFLSREYATKIKLLTGCAFYAFEETLEFVRRINKLDLHAVHYMPYQFLMGLDAIRANYFSLAERSDHPVWLYASDNWARALPPSFLEPFVDDRRFAGCKYSTSNAVKFEEAFRHNRDSFQVIPAVIKQLLPALALGARAYTSVEATLHLKRIRDIHRAFLDGDLKAARASQTQLNRLIEQMGSKAADQNFLRTAELKGVLERKGMLQRWMAPGFVDVSDADIDRLVATYDRASA
jgi:4-hydroxy-tetrahydrodipicolinate synthase